MLQYAVVIPTNRTFTHIEPLLLSLQTQVFLPSQIIIVLDCRLSNLEYRDYHDRVSSIFQSVPALSLVVVNPQSDSSFFVGKGASYVRNYGRKQVESSYMMFVDDDNIFDEYFAQNLFSRRGVGSEYHTTKKIDLTTLVVPVQYDDTSTYVRVAVADGFNFALCRPRWLTTELLATTSRYVDLQLASSNCLAGPTSLFSQFPFDEQAPFVYEDLMMTGSMAKAGVLLVCDTWTSLIHRHGERSVLASLYIHSSMRAYHKAKHRIFLVHIIGSVMDKVLFYIVGLRGQTAWLILHILIYAPVGDWWSLCSALWRGTRDGIMAVRA